MQSGILFRLVFCTYGNAGKQHDNLAGRHGPSREGHPQAAHLAP